MKQISDEIFRNTISSCTVGWYIKTLKTWEALHLQTVIYTPLLINSFWISHNLAYVHRSLLYSTAYDYITLNILLPIVNNRIIDRYILLLYDKYI